MTTTSQRRRPAARKTRAVAEAAVPAEIDAALARRDLDTPAYSELARRLESARGPSHTLRAAHALKSLERTLGKCP